MSKNEATVLYYQVGKEPVLKSIPNTLEASQKLVGGYIEYVYLEDGYVLVCNEEALLKDRPAWNRSTKFGGIVAGDFFVARFEDQDDDSGDLDQLDDEDVNIIRDMIGPCL